MLSIAEISEIYEKNADKIFRFFYSRTSNHTVSQDLTSTTFMKVVEKSDSFDPTKANLNTWLFTIARNTLIDYYRSAQRKATSASVDIEENENVLPTENNRNKTIDSFVINSRNKLILEKVLQQLPGDEQQLLFLRFTQEYSYEDISAEMGISGDAVGVKLHRLMTKLKKILEKQDLVKKIDR